MYIQLNRIIEDYQGSFVYGKLTVEAIHVIKQIAEKAYHNNAKIKMLFINFMQAFDKIKRNSIMEILEKIKITTKLKKINTHDIKMH